MDTIMRLYRKNHFIDWVKLWRLLIEFNYEDDINDRIYKNKV